MTTAAINHPERSLAVSAESSSVVSRLQRHVVLVLVLVYAVLGQTLTNSIGMQIPWWALRSFSLEIVILSSGAPLLLIATLAYQVCVEKRSLVDAIRLVVDTLKAFCTNRKRWIEALASLLCIKICLLVYNSLKQGIPIFHPVLFDDELALWDRWLTLGVSPTELLRSLCGAPLVTRTFDVLYVVWYLIKAPMFLLFVLHPQRAVRQQFFLSYVLTWMVCGACAMAIPSLGPCYATPEVLDGLEIPTARSLQERLWTKYAEVVTTPSAYKETLYDGVAAFPSLHVGAVVIFMVALRRWRVAGRCMAIYSVLILIGSVLLGWHYIVDGYFAALVAVLAYGFAGQIVGHDPRKTRTSPAATSAP